MYWVIVVLVVIAAGLGAALIARRRGGSGGFPELQRLANHRGWHFSRPDGTHTAYGLSAESMLKAGDGSNMDWRIRWHLRTSREEGKDRTEIKCADVPLEGGWVFLHPRAEAPGIKAMQRAAANDHDAPVKRMATWKEQLSRARDVPVGSPEFLDRYFVSSTVSEAVARRIISQRVQKAILALPSAVTVKARIGSEGVVVTTPAVFDHLRVEELVSLEEMLVGNVGQEQTVATTTQWQPAAR